MRSIAPWRSSIIPHVHHEGSRGWKAQQVVRDLERLGHNGRLVIRCDQEAALKSLVSEVARVRGDAVAVSEHSAVEDSQGNDFIERAV